jgi:hypothetical protein
VAVRFVTSPKLVPSSINVALATSDCKQPTPKALIHGICSIPDDRIGQIYFQARCHRSLNIHGRHANHPPGERGGDVHTSESTATGICPRQEDTESGTRMLSHLEERDGGAKGGLKHQSRRTAGAKAQRYRRHSWLRLTRRIGTRNTTSTTHMPGAPLAARASGDALHMIERQIAISDGGKRIASGDDKSTRKEGGANARKRKLLLMRVKRMTWYTTDADHGA